VTVTRVNSDRSTNLNLTRRDLPRPAVTVTFRTVPGPDLTPT
jgi:hypothetical protein